MPELPDITLYVEALEQRIVGHTLEGIALRSPFVLRTFDPPYRECEGRGVIAVRRQAKRIVIALVDELYIVMHLMKLGRLHWTDAGTKVKNPGKVLLATFTFDAGTLHLVEMGSKKRAALHVLSGLEAVRELDPGGLEVMEASFEAFAAVLRRRNHTLKRALTDPRLLSGIGNAYSDEILWEARLSPVKLTQKLGDEEMKALYEATRHALRLWTDRLREELLHAASAAGGGVEFPEKVTAFRAGMAVHGRYREPCPRCGAPVQRIVYADRETNYCAQCQTDGRPLADRALSRLLGQDWPKTMEELEELRGGGA